MSVAVPELAAAVLALAPGAAACFARCDDDADREPEVDLEIARLRSAEVSPLVFDDPEV